MPKAPLPFDEPARLAALLGFDLLDTPTEAAFDDLAKLAASITGAPVSLVSLVDADRQWFKAHVGTDLVQTPRDMAFCGYTILSPAEVMVVPDAAADPRFADNPLVTSAPHVRFYAGAPLVTPDGQALGSLCVLDTAPRQLTGQQVEALQMLGRQVVGQIRLRRAAAAVAASERFARATIDALPARVAVVDEGGRLMTANGAWRAASAGSSPDDPMGMGHLPGVSEADGAAVAAGVRDVLSGRRAGFGLEYAHAGRCVAGERWSLVRVSRFDDGGRPRAVVCHEDVTDRHAAADRLRHESRHDPLTGLPNRLQFAEQVDRSLAMARRHGHGFAVLLVDLDRFKIINDSLGHAAGDRLLAAVAARITECVRPSDYVANGSGDGPANGSGDGPANGSANGSAHGATVEAPPPSSLASVGVSTVARMGGDEFTVLLEQLASPADAARVAERVRAAIGKPVDFDGHELTTTASIGIVTCAGVCVSYAGAKELLRDADAAMYRAKAAGKDRYVVFDATMHAEVVARMTVEADLRRAVGRGELELHYQPIVTLGPGGTDAGTVGFEALVRWRRDGKLVSPAEFIPVAEDTGLIVPIGAWVLRRACRQLADWRAAGGPMADLYVTVNVSRKQLADAAFVGVVQDVLRETGLPPAAVGLEITESAIMDDPATAERTLLALKREAGVRLSVDDFGTGYSSLSCLQRFPIDLLKIDRSFVRNVAGDRRDAAVMRTIVSLAHDLDMRVVAEGIEQPEQAAFLSAARCDLTQGYLFSRPLTADAAERFVRDAARAAAA